MSRHPPSSPGSSNSPPPPPDEQRVSSIPLNELGPSSNANPNGTTDVDNTRHLYLPPQRPLDARDSAYRQSYYFPEAYPSRSLPFVLTLVLAVLAWIIAFVSQAVATAKVGNAHISTLWFAFLTQAYVLVVLVFYTFSTSPTSDPNAPAFRPVPPLSPTLPNFLTLSIVFAVLGVDRNIYSVPGSIPAQKAVAAGWLVTAMLDLVWLLFLFSPGPNVFVPARPSDVEQSGQQKPDDKEARGSRFLSFYHPGSPLARQPVAPAQYVPHPYTYQLPPLRSEAEGALPPPPPPQAAAASSPPRSGTGPLPNTPPPIAAPTPGSPRPLSAASSTPHVVIAGEASARLGLSRSVRNALGGWFKRRPSLPTRSNTGTGTSSAGGGPAAQDAQTRTGETTPVQNVPTNLDAFPAHGSYLARSAEQVGSGMSASGGVAAVLGIGRTGADVGLRASTTTDATDAARTEAAETEATTAGAAGIGAGGGRGSGGDRSSGATVVPAVAAPAAAAAGGAQAAAQAGQAGDVKVIARAEALYTYNGSPDDPNELTFKKGDIMGIIDSSGKWWDAVKSTGERGIVPSNYLRLL